MKLGSKQLIPISAGAMAVTFILLGIVKYGFWSDVHGPRPGFVPTIIAVIMLSVSLLALVQSFKEEKTEYPRENWLVILGGLGILALSYIFGLVLSCLAYVVIWLRFIEKSSWKETLIVLAVIAAIVIGVFVLWLSIPFPQGIIIETLLG